PVTPALYDEVIVTATPPGGTAAPLPSLGDFGEYTIADAVAGTWEIAASSDPASSNLVPLSPLDPVGAFVGPAANAVAPVITMIETGQIDVDIVDSNLQPVAAYTVDGETYPKVHVTQAAPGETVPTWANR